MYPVTRIEEKRGQREHEGTPPVNLEVHRDIENPAGTWGNIAGQPRVTQG